MTTTSAGCTSTPASVKSMTIRCTRSPQTDSPRSSPAAVSSMRVSSTFTVLGEAGLEQLDLDSSDGTPHLREGLALDASVLDGSKDSFGSPIDALMSVALCFSGRVLLAEDLTVALRGAAVAQPPWRTSVNCLAGSN